MKTAMWYIFVLILVFILVLYYRGTTNVTYQFSNFFNNLVLFLQGRNSAGQATNYPS